MKRTPVLCGYYRKYLERKIQENHVYKWNPLRGWVGRNIEPWKWGEYLPGEEESRGEQQKARKKRSEEILEPIREWTVFKGDRVEIKVGRDKGKHGLVKRVIKERNWVTVTGMNVEFIVDGATSTDPGRMIEKEKPLLVTTEISLVDPADLKPTTAEWRYTDDGRKVRVSTRTGREIPIPDIVKSTHDDGTDIQTYRRQEKDVLESELKKVTYVPKICSFEQDIMDSMGIKEDRPKPKTYWY